MTLRILTREREKDFIGEHFEGLADCFGALFGSVEGFFEHLSKSMEQGKKVFETDTEKSACIIKYPDSETISFTHFIGPYGTFESAYIASAPLLGGVEHSIKLTNHYTWKNGLEGEFCGLLCGRQKIQLSFYNPLFMRDITIFKAGWEYKVSLAALAFDIEPFKDREIKVNTNIFNKAKKDSSHGAKFNITKKDFPFSTFKISGNSFRSFMPSNYTCIFNAAGQIENISYTHLFNASIAVLKVNFGNKEHGDFLLNLYASPYVCGAYMPKEGDTIQTNLWLSGYFI